MIVNRSPCGEYILEDHGLYVVLQFADGKDWFAQGDSADIMRMEWANCVEAGFFRILDEYRPEVDA